MGSKIEVSYRTILFAVALIVGLWLVLQIRDILFLLFIAFLLMTALHPFVYILTKFRLPRFIAIGFVYLVIFGFLGVSFAGAIPALIVQSTRFMQELPFVVTRVLPYWNIDIGAFTSQIAPIGENVVKVTVGIFSNIVTTLTVLVFTFYFLLERHHAQVVATSLMGETVGIQVLGILRKIEKRLGTWVRGELILMAFVGIFSYIGLLVLHVEFALPLAIVAGLFELVPTIGPIVSAVPAVLVALGVSPLFALSVAALYFIVQQIENNILVPLVMRHVTGFSPLITIIALMIGARLAGITGIILAVPILLVFQVLVEEFVEKQ
ncbi:AI-2E family transporter [Candidatus Gottesmanbacteria bacterium]|nr:AI-2E family transporter [Candidatus Gottesmanbacteria bacterium]